MGGAEDMLEGVFKVAMSGIYRHPSQGNYQRKIFAATVIAERMGYARFMSIDDDIVVSPEGLLQLLRSSDMLEEGRCGMITPTLSTGVPTAELFAEAFMSEEDREELYGCFQESSILDETWDGGYEFGAGGDGDDKKWNAAKYYESIWSLTGDHLVKGPISSLGLALHPVR